MKHTRSVDSSNLHEVEYDDETEVLVVTFKGGARYAYEGVKKYAYDALVEAESVGKHFATYIRNDYVGTRL